MLYDNKHFSRKHTIKIYAKQNNKLLDLLLSFIWNYSLDNEEWREIKGLEGRYYISNYGRVLSLCCDGYKLLRPFTCGDGYDYVDLRVNNKDVKSRVHRLVANAFVPNPDDKPIVHHKDCDRKNNKADNLVFLTNEEHGKEHKEINQQKKDQGNEKLFSPL